MMTAAIGLFLTFLADPVSTPAIGNIDQEEKGRIEVIKTAVPTAVCIFGMNSDGGGSGVLINPEGYAVTNFHVTREAGNYFRGGLSDGQLYDAVIVGVDPVGDLAVIKLIGKPKFPCSMIGDSESLRVGQEVFAVGNPFLLAMNLEPTVTLGIISGLHRYQYPEGESLLEYTDCLQTDAAINPGNSGGPLFDLTGKVVGINGRISLEKRGRVSVGVGYAISARQVKNFLPILEAGLVADHARLGAVTRDDDAGKVIVDEILPASDAYRRGLREGDEVIAIAGRAILSSNDVKNIIGVFPADWRVPISYRHESSTVNTYVRLAGVLEEKRLMPLTPARPPSPNKPKADAEPAKELKAMFTAKPGFANYFFNRKGFERLTREYVGPRSAPSGQEWELTFNTKQGEGKITLGESRAELRVGPRSFLYRVGLNLEEADEPTKILACLDEYRRFTLGISQSSESYDWAGKYPLNTTNMVVGQDWPSEDILCDVIRCTRGGTDSLWFLHPKTHNLMRLEFADSAGSWAMEMDFAETKSTELGPFPAKILLNPLGDTPTELVFSRFALVATAPKSGGSP